MAKPNLLLCFDAFGTLFKPKRPVAEQYAEVARQCGLTGFNDQDVQSCFRTAFKEEAKQNPNYGKATGLGATKWWTNVIRGTFTPLIKNNQPLPTELVPKLLHRFFSDEGYEAAPSLIPALRALRDQQAQRRFDQIIIGVITNSDDRVPSVLSSLGVAVSPLRYGTNLDPGTAAAQDHDIDFHCISYDVGVEKPNKLIFNAAELMLMQIIAMRGGRRSTGAQSEAATWQKIYVGDEYVKDAVGAADAGWNSVLLEGGEDHSDLTALRDSSAQSVHELFKQSNIITVGSIQELTTWLTGGTK